MSASDSVPDFSCVRKIKDLTGGSMQALAASSGVFTPDGSFYVFGGGNSESMSNTLYRVLPDGSYTVIETGDGIIPSQRGGASLVYLPAKDALFLFGGMRGAKFYNDAYLFYIKEQRWVSLSATEEDWPSVRHEASMITISDTKVLMYGGQGTHIAGSTDKLVLYGVVILGDVWIFDVETMSWEEKNIPDALLVQPRHGATACLLTHKHGTRAVYFFGGVIHGKCTKNLVWLDISMWVWHCSAYDQLTEKFARTHHAAVVANDHTMVIYGGRNTDGASLDDVLVYDSHAGWKCLYAGSQDPTSFHREWGAFACFSTKLFIFGGVTSRHINDKNTRYHSDIIELDLQKLSAAPLFSSSLEDID